MSLTHSQMIRARRPGIGHVLASLLQALTSCRMRRTWKNSPPLSRKTSGHPPHPRLIPPDQVYGHFPAAPRVHYPSGCVPYLFCFGYLAFHSGRFGSFRSHFLVTILSGNTSIDSRSLLGFSRLRPVSLSFHPALSHPALFTSQWSTELACCLLISLGLYPYSYVFIYHRLRNVFVPSS